MTYIWKAAKGDYFIQPKYICRSIAPYNYTNWEPTRTVMREKRGLKCVKLA